MHPCSVLFPPPSSLRFKSFFGHLSTFPIPLLVVFSDMLTRQVESDVVAQSWTMETQRLSRISKLASIIATNTAIYDKYIFSQGLPSPSCDINTPFKLDLSDEVSLARDIVLEASTELQALVHGPLRYSHNQTLNVSQQDKIHRHIF